MVSTMILKGDNIVAKTINVHLCIDVTKYANTETNKPKQCLIMSQTIIINHTD